MKPIQKQTGEIKLNRENPQFGYFLSFARRECSKSTRLHPSQMRKATKQPDCTVPKCGRQQNKRIALFPNAEGPETIKLAKAKIKYNLNF